MTSRPERGAMARYTDEMNRRMAMLSAADLREDIYLIPLRPTASKDGGSRVLSGQAWLGAPGRYLTLEVRRLRSDGEPQRHIGRLLGLTLPGAWCEAALGATDVMPPGTALTGVFDFGGCRFDVRILPFTGPHPVVGIAVLARRDPEFGEREQA